MSSPKVLYIQWNFPQISETYIHTEIEFLIGRYDISVISFKRPNVSCPTPVPYTYIELGDLEALEAAIKDFGPDVIHGHWLFMAPALNHAARIAKAPFTIRSHSFDVLGRTRDRLIQEIDFVNSESCLGVLAFPFARSILEDAGMKSDKIRNCFPVVNFERFYNEAPNGNSVMNVGACTPKKRMEDFLQLGCRLPEKTFNLYAIGYDSELLKARSRELKSGVNFVDPVTHASMAAEYKKHEWLAYTADPIANTVGWPIAVAEAQAAGVGVCVQNLRPDIEEYIGEAGYVYDTIEELIEIISEPFSEEKRQQGFNQARKSDIKSHIGLLDQLWRPVIQNDSSRLHLEPDSVSAQAAVEMNLLC